MYTIEMAKAFKKIKAPKNFGVLVYENENFITIQINPKQLINLTEKETEDAINYVNKVKKTFENLGAVVFVIRETIEKEKQND